MSCHFAHKGFPVSENRCITCGKPDHSYKECTAPGGGKDPNREAVLTAYRQRKEANAPANKKGKGKGDGADGGKGKKVKAKAKEVKVTNPR